MSIQAANLAGLSGVVIGSLTALVVVFFVDAAILYLIWNKVLRDLLPEGFLNEMSYVQAMGLAWLLFVFFKPVLFSSRIVSTSAPSTATRLR